MVFARGRRTDGDPSALRGGCAEGVVLFWGEVGEAGAQGGLLGGGEDGGEAVVGGGEDVVHGGALGVVLVAIELGVGEGLGGAVGVFEDGGAGGLLGGGGEGVGESDADAAEAHAGLTAKGLQGFVETAAEVGADQGVESGAGLLEIGGDGQDALVGGHAAGLHLGNQVVHLVLGGVDQIVGLGFERGIDGELVEGLADEPEAEGEVAADGDVGGGHGGGDGWIAGLGGAVGAGEGGEQGEAGDHEKTREAGHVGDLIAAGIGCKKKMGGLGPGVP